MDEHEKAMRAANRAVWWTRLALWSAVAPIVVGLVVGLVVLAWLL